MINGACEYDIADHPEYQQGGEREYECPAAGELRDFICGALTECVFLLVGVCRYPAVGEQGYDILVAHVVLDIADYFVDKFLVLFHLTHSLEIIRILF